MFAKVLLLLLFVGNDAARGASTGSAGGGRTSSSCPATTANEHHRTKSLFHRRDPSPSLAVVFPPVVQNLARGSLLKCLADLTGGLPLEVWKSSVVLENIQRSRDESNKNNNVVSPPPPPSSSSSSLAILKSIVRERGILALWSGLSPRMVEGLFSGGILLAAKEGLHTVLSDYASPMLAKSVVGITLPPSFIGFVSGAGGGCAQALIMGPTSLVVTACVAASREQGGGLGGEERVSAFRVAREVLRERGIRGLYRGAPAVAVRQATNWASRQGFTEFVRPMIPIDGAVGELIAGCIGGTLSAWNTPFEVARIESQSGVMAKSGGGDNDGGKGKSLVATMCDIVEERGAGALYVGLIPRAAQACYQTLFLVCVPRLLQSAAS